MMKRFTVWLEEIENQIKKKQELMNSLLSRLDLNKSALNNNDIMISNIKFSKIKSSIESLQTTEENKQAMIAFAQQNSKGLSLKQLIDKINPNGAESQDTSSSVPATLPQGTQPAPKPFNQQQNQQPQNQQSEPELNLQ